MGEIVKEGLLLKEEAGEAKWKKRWVVLKDCDCIGTLNYYKVDDYINQRNPIDSFTVCSCAVYEYLARAFAFELVWPPVISPTVQPADHLRFQATNSDEQRTWIDALRPYTMPVEKEEAPLEQPDNCTDTIPTPRSTTAADDATTTTTATAATTTTPRPTTPRPPTPRPPTPRCATATTTSTTADKPTTSRPTTPNTATKTAVPPVRKLRDFGDDEVVLMELFPDISVDIILDALDFCNADRAAAIQLLANQNRLTAPTEEVIDSDEDENDITWIDDSVIGQPFVHNLQDDNIEKRRGANSLQIKSNKEPIQTPFKRSVSWHKAGPSTPNKSPSLFDFAIRKHFFRKSCDGVYSNSEGGAAAVGDTSPSSQAASHQPAPPNLRINVVGAVLNGSYMEYVLEVTTSQARWLVYRRYSNFFAFHKRLCKLKLVHPSQHVLPPKGIKGNMSEGLVKRRTTGLEKYLNSLLEGGLSQVLLSNPIGKMFIDPSISSLLFNKQLEIC